MLGIEFGLFVLVHFNKNLTQGAEEVVLVRRVVESSLDVFVVPSQVCGKNHQLDESVDCH